MNTNQIPEEYQPLGMWSYFGYTLLFSIPLVGFICILVFSFGGASNINLRNFARSYLCCFILGLIFAVIAVIIAISVGIGLADLFSDSSIFDFIFRVLPCAF